MSAARMLKRAAKAGFASSAGWAASAPFRPRGVVVLMYHRIHARDSIFPGMPVAQFRSQMEWIARNCTPIASDQVLEAAPRASRLRPPVVVTFDDGYRDYHDCAWPILRELGIPATVFLSTTFMDHGGLIWNEELEWAIMTSARSSVTWPWDPSQRLTLADTAQRRECVRLAKQQLKGMPDAARRDAVADLHRQLDAPSAERTLGRQMLSWDEVRASREGTIFGGHSHTHPILSQLPRHEMESEIRTCRERIATELGSAPRTFAYPNGRACDFNADTRELLALHGFELAFSTERGINGQGADRMALLRQPTGGSNLGDLAALVAGA